METEAQDKQSIVSHTHKPSHLVIAMKTDSYINDKEEMEPELYRHALK